MLEKIIIILMLLGAVAYFVYTVFSKKKGCNCGDSGSCAIKKMKK